MAQAQITPSPTRRISRSVEAPAARSPKLMCERGCGRPARFCAWEEPEQHGQLDFGDELCGVLLCRPCLAIDERQGPWQGVDPL